MTGDVMEAAPEKAKKANGDDKAAIRAGSGKTKPATAAKKSAVHSHKADTPKKRTGKKATESRRRIAKPSSGKKSTRGSGTLDDSDPRKPSGDPGTGPESAAVAQTPAAPADDSATPDTAPHGDPEATSPQDTKSLAWMAAQAVNALNAVKASQAEKLQAMLAAAETPDAGQGESDTPPQERHADESRRVAGTAPHTSAMADHPSGESRAARSPGAEPKPGVEAGERQPAASTEQVIAARAAAGHRMPLRPVLLFGMIAIAGWLGYRYWPGERGLVEVTEEPEAAVVETLRERNIGAAALPQNPAITVVVDEPAVHPASESAAATTGQATAPAQEPEAAPVVMTAPVPDTAAAVPPVPRTALDADAQPAVVRQEPESPPVATMPAPPATATAVEPETVAQRQAPENREVAPPAQPARRDDTPATAPARPSPVMAGEAAPPTSRRNTRPSQPRYRNPGYGYYPQQPSWQQRYPNSGYTQYPPR